MPIQSQKTAPIQAPLTVLYQDDKLLIVQTHAGDFDKFHPESLYGSFNLGLHVKDNPKQVLQRRAQLLQALTQLGGQPICAIHWLNQVHGDGILAVDTQSPTMQAVSADACISGQAGRALAIMTADCVPIVLYDKNSQAIACIHAGWQGLVNGIIAKTAARLRQYSAAPQLSAVMGACIAWQSYEIDIDLAQRIVRTCVELELVAQDFETLYTRIIHPSTTAQKVLIDIQTLAVLELTKLGIDVYNTQAPCSYQTPNLYSYRAQTHANKPATGRMATVVVRLS